MENERMRTKMNLGIQWVKSESGNTYLCPVGALDGIQSPTEADYNKFCVNESNNPHNS